jgi:acetyl esterase/lipase
MIHVFQAFGWMLPEAREAITVIGEFLRKRTS